VFDKWVRVTKGGNSLILVEGRKSWGGIKEHTIGKRHAWVHILTSNDPENLATDP